MVMRVISLNSRNSANPLEHGTLNIGTLNIGTLNIGTLKIWELR